MLAMERMLVSVSERVRDSVSVKEKERGFERMHKGVCVCEREGERETNH